MTPPKFLSDSELESLLRRAIALPDAPASWVSRAAALFEPRPQADWGRALQALVGRVGAVLRFDSWAPAPLPAGVRGVPSETRHLLYSTQGRDIDLRITPSAGEYAVAGQILGPDDAGTVELSSDDAGRGASSHTTALDELGEFRLEGVRRGTYRLRLRVGRDEIELPPFAVGDRPS